MKSYMVVCGLAKQLFVLITFMTLFAMLTVNVDFIGSSMPGLNFLVPFSLAETFWLLLHPTVAGSSSSS